MRAPADQDPQKPPLTIGIGLKMYFGYQQTISWCKALLEIVALRPQLLDEGGELFVLPSFPALNAVADLTSGTGVGVGSQDIHWEDAGPFTGAVSGSMLAEIGCRYAEVGHAERRLLFKEDDDVVALKTEAALRNGMVPIICIGEVDRLDHQMALVTCTDQLTSALSRHSRVPKRVIVAYEPVWAIGASEPAPPRHIRAVCTGIRLALESLPISSSSLIYGGTAGPGLLGALEHCVDGLFLGRSAHDLSALASVLDDACSSLL